MKPSDFNKKLREQGVEKKVTVQKICRVCRDEKEVRETLDQIWKVSEKAEKLLDELYERNNDIFSFERMLDRKRLKF